MQISDQTGTQPRAAHPTEWIAIEVGSAGLRVWSMPGGTPLKEAAATQGTSLPDVLSRLSAEFEFLTGAAVNTGDNIPVLVSGLTPAPAVTLPVQPLAVKPALAATDDTRFAIHALPGLEQGDPPDVLHGDAVRVAGFLSLNQGWDGVICQPGGDTGTSWVHVSAGEIVSVQSFLTPALFRLLTGELNIAPDPADGTHGILAAQTSPAFETALDSALSRPERLAAALNSLRVRVARATLTHEDARARLWGQLIGAELAGARAYWLGQQVAVIGPPEVSTLYQAALTRQGAPVTLARETAMTLAGFASAHRRIAG